MNRNLKQNLLIIAGVVLVLSGAVGAMFDLYQAPAPKVNGMFIGPMKPYRVAPSPEPAATTLPTETQSPEPTEAPLPSSLDVYSPKSYFVHDPASPALEKPAVPDRIVILAIGLDAPVVPADFNFAKVEGETFGQWMAPDMFAAGWHPESALLGTVGNTVINGHHNVYGEVFGKLVDVKVGDIIEVYSRGRKFSFIVANRMILPERFQPAEVRLENARWISATNDIRLTLVTCWPQTSNTHRLILVARPIDNP